MLANSSNEWQLDKILPASRWPKRLFVVGWGIAIAAILLCGLAWSWKLLLVALACLLMWVSRKRTPLVRSISVNQQHCRLRLDNNQQIELTPPYQITRMVWWLSLYKKEGFNGHWIALYRDQFNEDEWRHLLVLLRWSSESDRNA